MRLALRNLRNRNKFMHADLTINNLVTIYHKPINIISSIHQHHHSSCQRLGPIYTTPKRKYLDFLPPLNVNITLKFPTSHLKAMSFSRALKLSVSGSLDLFLSCYRFRLTTGTVCGLWSYYTKYHSTKYTFKD